VIEGQWQAWYGGPLKGGSPPLHVVGECEADRPLGTLLLEEDTGCGCGTGVICLTLAEEPDERGRNEREVSWSGRPKKKVTEVRVAGASGATLPVRDDR
jgi:hypothetical protein